MDSPNLIPPSFILHKTMSQKPTITNDSGYITVTPSSAESTRSHGDISSNTSINPAFHHSTETKKKFINSSFSCYTPSFDMSSYRSQGSKELGKNRADLDQGVSFLDASMDTMSSTRMLQSRTSNVSRRGILERQGGIEMDWSPIETQKQDKKYVNTQTPLLPVHNEDILISDVPNTYLTCSMSPLRIDPSHYDNIHKTPKKYGISNTSRVIKSRPVKKISFPSQKLGTPEKNKLLYSQLIPVTPPQKPKSPEKLKSTTSKDRSTKKLCWKNNCHCGLDKIDFIKKLIGNPHIIRNILFRISETDLMNASQVSTIWKYQISNDSVLNKRLIEHETLMKSEKENLEVRHQDKPIKKIEKMSSLKSFELMDTENIRNIMPEKKSIARSPPVSPGKRRFHHYMKVASQDLSNELRSCPRCHQAAIIHDKWATCEGLACGFTFCINCLNEKRYCSSSCTNMIKAASPNKDSPMKTVPTKRKSRKNLRRLLF